MEIRLLLWVYLISAVYSVAIVLRRLVPFGRRHLFVSAGLAATAAAGLLWPEALEVWAFWVSTAGFLVFMLLPGLLVRLGRRAALGGRFRRASRLLRATALLVPLRGLSEEAQFYRRIHEGGGVTHPAAEGVRRRLAARAAATRSPRFTPVGTALALLVIAVHLAASLKGNTTSIFTLLELGANCAPLVEGGEAWRLFTAQLLHIGWLHLAINAAALWFLCLWVEPRLGAARTLLTFLLSGLVGNVASLYLLLSGGLISAGASGGAMGLAGAATAIFLKARDDPLAARRRSALLLTIGATFLVGFLEPGIDNGAHLGGLLTGFALGALFVRGALPLGAARVGATALSLAMLVSVILMVTAIPRWEGTELYRNDTFELMLPRFYRPEAGDRFALVNGTIADFHVDLIDPGTEAKRPPAQNGNGRRTEVHLVREKNGSRSALLVFTLPSSDPLLHAKAVDPVVESFRFR